MLPAWRTKREDPHPDPCHPLADPQPGESGEGQSGKHELGEGVDEEKEAVGFGEDKERHHEPLEAWGAEIEPVLAGVDPVPLALGQPVQDPGKPIGQRIVVVRGVENPPEHRQSCQQIEDGRQGMAGPPLELRPAVSDPGDGMFAHRQNQQEKAQKKGCRVAGCVELMSGGKEPADRAQVRADENPEGAQPEWGWQSHSILLGVDLERVESSPQEIAANAKKIKHI